MSSAYSHAIRRRHTKSRIGSANRDSSAVRASVLQTALELGIAQNPTVANWIFNNPLEEEPEEISLEQTHDPPPETEVVEVRLLTSSSFPPVSSIIHPQSITPTLTYSSNTTSDDSSVLNSPQNNVATATFGGLQVHMHKPSVAEPPPHVHFDDFSSENLQLFSPVFPSFPSSSSTSGGQNDGNLMVRCSKESYRASSHDDSLRHSRSNETPSPGPTEAGYSSEGQYLSKGKGKERGKEKFGKTRIKKWMRPAALDLSKGDDREGDYNSDGGYLSASSNKSLSKSPGKAKSRAMAFFRRRPKKPQRGSDDEDEDYIPPVPALPVFPKSSSPKALGRNGAASSSPTRANFTPLTLGFSKPVGSPPKRKSSRSPPPVRVAPASSRCPLDNSLKVTPVLPRATLNLPTADAPTAPHTPLPVTLLTDSPTSAPSLTHRANVSSSRHHLNMPPPAPPPSQPLPQLPPSPSIPSRRLASPPPIPSSPTTPARRPPARQVPPSPVVAGTNPKNPSLAPVQPLSPRSSSPFRSLSPRRGSPVHPPPVPRLAGSSNTRSHSDMYVNLGSHVDAGRPAYPVMLRQNSAPVVPHGTGVATALLHRRLHGQQNGALPPSPPHPPPDAPLPPAPTPSLSVASARSPTGPSKFHEHFSSVSSVSHVLTLPSSTSTSRAPSRSGSSSGPSVISSHTSSSEQSSIRLQIRDARTSTTTTTTTATDDSLPGTSSSSRVSGSSYGQLGTEPIRLVSRFSDTSLGLRLGLASTDDDDADANVEEACKEGADADVDEDDASYYPSDEKTAGRRTMYLVEHGQVDEAGDEIVIAGSHYWGKEPYPPLPTRPGPGYF
ncbi:hypothetical protein SCLCIDRAFT_12066 [Scleroderma citrinum Foug A]|uniref:Uncharacterized protein n=1 Tax=Scleroderma citrinum Foug A TaxID=1036808 RepID=A0A0C2YPQ2_9AGAM|nr:hypothetical protein SCLCIDRAFT_12066 [Scleroderma citrinum Foug A]